MKNKKVVYFLLPATLVVWIVIVLRIYNTLNPGAEINTLSVNKIKQELPEQMISDTFSIENNYRDPFGKSATLAVNRSSDNSNSPLIQKKNIQTVTISKGASWPVIIYSGMIKNQKSNKQLVLVSINGNLKTMKTGDITDNVQIGKIYRDSIEVILGSQRKFILK